jgi:hypothetical protein
MHANNVALTCIGILFKYVYQLRIPHRTRFDEMRYFDWLPTEVVKKTFQHTTQLARTTTGTLLKRKNVYHA